MSLSRKKLLSGRRRGAYRAPIGKEGRTPGAPIGKEQAPTGKQTQQTAGNYRKGEPSVVFSRIPVIIDGVVADEMLLCGVNMRARSYRMEAQRKSTIFLNGVSPHL